jgi:hypothetical protein
MEPTKISEKVPSSTSQTIESTNMYDLMKTNEDMALSIIKTHIAL